MTKVEQVLNLIPPEDMHYVDEWKEGKAGFKGAAKKWLRTKDPVKDDAEIARAIAGEIALARKYDSEQRTKRGAKMSNRECANMEKRNVAFMERCRELGIQV